MPKSKKSKKPISSTPSANKPTQILLDESFILCASRQGCESKEEYCQEESENTQISALIAILLASVDDKIALVLDDAEPSQVARFYRDKYESMSDDVKNALKRWLDGRRDRLSQYKPAKMKPSVVKQCNLKEGTLDPLLCRLAIASRGEAPIWTLDSDFFCASQFYQEIKPTCPKNASDSMR